MKLTLLSKQGISSILCLKKKRGNIGFAEGAMTAN